MYKKRGKKGQITLFIIIGIILVISAALLFYLREQEIIFKPKPPLIPTEVAPIDDYVKSCISELGAEAAEIIGRTGGYIRFPSEIEGDTLSYIHLSPLETGKNPYWYYQGEQRIPTEEYIVGEMDHYISTNLRECLQELEVFSEQYDIKELGAIATKTTLGEEGIPVEVDYPLEISDKQGRKITTLESFEVVVPYRLKTTYEVAKQIMEAEERDMKLEELTIDLIALDPDIPYSNMEFTCQKRRWQIADIENKLKMLLRTDLPLIRVDTTSYSPIPVNQPYVANHYVWDVTEQPYPDIKIGFTYDQSWPLKLVVRPNRGTYIESGMQQGSQIASWLCVQIWKFTYDVVYPVMVTVADERTGYSFSFSFRVLVNQNQATRDAFAHSYFDFEPATEVPEEYCGRRVNEITVLTYDNVSDDYLPINDVNLTYTCLKYACPIGVSEYKSGGAVASITEKFPYCVWGVLTGAKEGYEDGQLFFGSDTPKTVEIYLKPLKTIQFYNVVKHELDWDSQQIGSEEKLAQGELATIAIERDELSTYGAYSTEIEQAPLTFLAEDDFNYKLTVYLSDDEELKGGYVLEDWTVDWTDLEAADEITFHVVYVDEFDDDAQELAFMSGLGTYSARLPLPELRPR